MGLSIEPTLQVPTEAEFLIRWRLLAQAAAVAPQPTNACARPGADDGGHRDPSRTVKCAACRALMARSEPCRACALMKTSTLRSPTKHQDRGARALGSPTRDIVMYPTCLIRNRIAPPADCFRQYASRWAGLTRAAAGIEGLLHAARGADSSSPRAGA
jgi:hypothetical protein